MNDIEQRKKTFIRFLKENDCYTNYMYNLKNHKSFHDSYLFNDINEIITIAINSKNNIYTKNEFTCAFSWDMTKEGFFYWKNKSIKWNEINYETR